MLTLPTDAQKNWGDILAPAMKTASFQALESFLDGAERSGRVIYPPKDKIFTAFTQTGFDNVKIIILGQDPYHGAGQAHGLCFSVPDGVKLPPRLRNIFKEIARDLGHPIPKSGDLTPWARQGVFLLNTVMTVEEASAGAHQGKGWEDFTDTVIRALSDNREHLVFMLWGAHAQKKMGLIDGNRHLVLESVHPSPLSAHRGFIGCGHFSKANLYLAERGQTPVNWAL